jgi:hypothetical protein
MARTRATVDGLEHLWFTVSSTFCCEIDGVSKAHKLAGCNIVFLLTVNFQKAAGMPPLDLGPGPGKYFIQHMNLFVGINGVIGLVKIALRLYA